MRTTGRQTFVMLGPMLAFAAAVPLAQGARNTVASKSAPKAAATRDVPTDVPTTLQAAADALGMLRFINRVDTLGTMEFFAKGTTATLGPTDYYGSLSYLEPAMRVVMTSIPATSLARGGVRREAAAQRPRRRLRRLAARHEDEARHPPRRKFRLKWSTARWRGTSRNWAPDWYPAKVSRHPPWPPSKNGSYCSGRCHLASSRRP